MQIKSGIFDLERDISLKIYAVKIEQIQKHIFEELLSYISVDEQEKIKRFRRYEDAIRGLTSKMLLRFIIVSLLGEQNKNIHFDKNDYGKPFLVGTNDFHFNLSHSGDWVVCVVDNLPVGIDVEKIHDVDLNLSKRFFSEDEHQYLLTVESKRRREAFFDLWTLKESYIKADGRGLSIPLNSFSFSFEGGNIKFKTSNNFGECYFKRYEIDASYKLAVCSKKSEFPEGIIDITFDELVRIVQTQLEKQ